MEEHLSPTASSSTNVKPENQSKGPIASITQTGSGERMRDCGICSIYSVEDSTKQDEMESIIDQNPAKLHSIVEDKNEEEEEKKEEESPSGNINEKREPENPVDEVNVIQLGEERDFDTNPTELYLSLMRKDWDAAQQRCEAEPSEAAIPIYRKEDNGNLRWKLLPIHACVIFGAPEHVLGTLLKAFPHGTLAVDDQGMVPLHLAMRMASSEEVIDKLVANGPGALKAQDRKGRTPRDLAARNANAATKSMLITALENCESKYVVAEEVPKDVVVEEEKIESGEVKAEDDPASIVLKGIETPRVDDKKTSIFADKMPTNGTHDRILDTLRVAHETAFESLKIEHTQTVQIMKITHQKEIDALQSKNKDAYEKLRSESGIKQSALNERITFLETSLETLRQEHTKLQLDHKEVSESESKLRSEHDELKNAAESAHKSKETTESANKAVITNLVNQVGDLQTKLIAEVATRESLDATLAGFEEQKQTDMGKTTLRVVELEDELEQVTSLKNELQKTLVVAEAKVSELAIANESYKSENAELLEKSSTSQKKLEEVTLSEQELAWKSSSLQQKLKETYDSDEAQKRIATLEDERKELKNTIETLSVKLYKVVGFLDEMVQEQDAIIVESMTMEGEATQESDDDRLKLLTNVTSMKEQIGAVIDSVIDDMPDVEQASEDEQDADNASTEKKTDDSTHSF